MIETNPLSDDCANALVCLHAEAARTGNPDIITNPWVILERNGVSRDVAFDLIRLGVLVQDGPSRALRFRIVPEGDAVPAEPAADKPTNEPAALVDAGAPIAPLPANGVQPTQAYALLIDVENVEAMYRAADIPMDFDAVRDCARDVGDIAFALAFANFSALHYSTRSGLGKAGLTLVHCERLRLPNGAHKDTVDAHLMDWAMRLLTYARLDGIIIATNDRDFLPLIHAIRDRGRTCVVLTMRHGSALAVAANRAIALPIPGKRTTDASDAWVPELVLDGLKEMELLPAEQQPLAIARMATVAPLVVRVLRGLVYRRKCRQTSFHSLRADARTTVPQHLHDDVSDDDLSAFLTALIAVGVIARGEWTDEHAAGGPQTKTGYRINDAHPFVRLVLETMTPRAEDRRQGADGAVTAVPPATPAGTTPGAPQNGRQPQPGANGAAPLAEQPGDDARTYYVVNSGTDDVLTVAAADEADAVDRAMDYYREQDAVSELPEQERALILTTLRTVPEPPPHATPIPIRDDP